MAVARVQVELNRDQGLPEDVVTNTYHYKASGGGVVTTADAVALADGVADAYLTQLSNWGAQLSGSGTVSVFDLSDTPPRIPRAVDTRTVFVSPSTTALPSELSVVASFQAAPASGVNQARRRGRVYLGPFDTSTTQYTAATADVRVNPAHITVVTAFISAISEITAPTLTPWRLAIYSPTSDLEGMSTEDATVEAENGWVDNAWDIQRRRGADPTTRNVFAIP